MTTLAERVRHVLARSAGTMPVCMHVADEAERAEVERLLARHRHKGAGLVTTITKEGDEVRWLEMLGRMSAPPACDKQPPRPRMVRGN